MDGLKNSFQWIHKALSEHGIDHALIGGFALSLHGINRATGDIDLLIEEENREKIALALAPARYAIRAQTEEIIHFEGPIRLDVLLARRPLSRKMLARAPTMSRLNVKCLTAEDLIGLKIQAYCNDPRREYQDKADIQFLIGKYPKLDWKTVREYADIFGQWDQIESIRKKI